MRKIGICQTKGEYPTLHIIVTDNERYLDGRKRLVVATVEEALMKVESWLWRRLNE